jgi:hypothetical protein
VAIQVGPGTRPLVNWTPACGVTRITVNDSLGAAGLPLWEHFSAPTLIMPPVRYGSSPTALPTLVRVDSLTIGQRYTVYVARGLPLDPAAAVDSVSFVAR